MTLMDLLTDYEHATEKQQREFQDGSGVWHCRNFVHGNGENKFPGVLFP